MNKLAILLSLTFLSATAFADDSIQKVLDLNEIVYTGTRTPKALKNTPVQTRLITGTELRRVDATNVQDLLQQELPGVEFSYAMNQQMNMNFAGFSGQNLLVLLDGERLAGETMENTDFSRLSMNGIARIEIIRGAASALYGSNAAGGVINLISKDAYEPWRLNFNVKNSEHDEWRAGCEAAFHRNKVSNVLDVSFHRIGTYSVCNDASDKCDFRNVYGFEDWNFRNRFTYKPSQDISLTARAGYFFKERYYNPDTPDRYRDFSAGLRGIWNVSEDDCVELSYSFDQYDKSDFIKASGLDVRDYSNVQNILHALYNHQFSNVSSKLSIGGDLTSDYLLTYQFGPGETHRQTTADIFAQYDWDISSAWEIVGAARWDYFSESKLSHATTKLSVRYNYKNLTLRGGYAGGFRAPTLKEMYMNFNMQDIFDFHGYKDLKPEVSSNFNLSGEYTWRNFYFMLGGNYNFISNRITTSGIRYAADHQPYIDYVNVAELRVFGLDASVRAQWSNGISASLNYNFTHEENVSESITQYCPARPHSLNARLSYKKNRSDITLSGRFLSRVSYNSMYMYEPFEQRQIINPAYTMWKLQYMQTIGEGITATIAVDNLFNYRPKTYAFNAPVTTGANLQVGLSIDLEKLFY